VALGGFYLAVLVIAWPVVLLIPREWTGGITGLGATSVPTVLAALVVNALLVRIGASHWRTVGWQGLRHGVRWFAWGASFGIAMALGTLVLAVLAGSARLEVTPEPVVRYLGAAVRVGLVLCVAALAEELLFRGYPLARLARSLGRVGASVALGVLFVALHTGNPNVTTLGLANIGLASLVLSAAFFTPGGLPVAWGVHFGWNSGLGLGADAPVSGLSFGLPLLDFTAGGPSWLTGGSFGPEGGLVATVVMAVALGLLVRRARMGGVKKKNVTQETERA
jgi:membrane protease YdiL (CAAX protease family)